LLMNLLSGFFLQRKVKLKIVNTVQFRSEKFFLLHH